MNKDKQIIIKGRQMGMTSYTEYLKRADDVEYMSPMEWFRHTVMINPTPCDDSACCKKEQN